MRRLTPQALALLALFGPHPVQALDIRSSAVAGRGSPAGNPLCADPKNIEFNRADRTLTICDPSGAPSTTTLLKALPSGKRAVELGQSDEQTVGGVRLETVISRPGGKTTLTPDAVQILGAGSTGEIPLMGLRLGGTGALPRSILDRFAELPVSVKDFGGVCDGITDVAPAVKRAVDAGYKTIRLPPNCLYKLVNNVTPDGVTIIGDDDRTSIVSVQNRATDYLSLGARSIIRNVGTINKTCDDVANPGGVQKICPVGEAANIADAPTGLSNWVGQRLFFISGPTYTNPNGVQSHDLPIIALIARGAGTDGLYTATDGVAEGASGIRVVTAANNDNGIYLLNGFYGPATNSHCGLCIKEFSSSPNSRSLDITRLKNAPSIVLHDEGGSDAGLSSNYITMTMSKQASGNLINMYQTITPFSGNLFAANVGNGGGTFTGQYIQFTNQGSLRFQVGPDGSVTSAGSVAASGALTGASSTVTGTAQAARLGVGGAPPLATTAAVARLYGNMNMMFTNRSISGNVYFDNGWKFTSNGSAGYIQWPGDTTAFRVSYTGVNAGGADATASPNAALEVTTGGLIVHNVAFTPASSTAPCTPGTQAWDANYTYVCVAANTWKRSKSLDAW